MAIIYRDGPVDLAQLADLRARCDFAPRTPEELRQQITGARWVVSAHADDALVGFARAISDGITNAYISSVMVDAAHRRHGIGRELIRRLTDGRDHLRWVLHAREGAGEFYRALGFTPASDMLWRGRRGG